MEFTGILHRCYVILFVNEISGGTRVMECLFARVSGGLMAEKVFSDEKPPGIEENRYKVINYVNMNHRKKITETAK